MPLQIMDSQPYMVIGIILQVYEYSSDDAFLVCCGPPDKSGSNAVKQVTTLPRAKYKTEGEQLHSYLCPHRLGHWQKRTNCLNSMASSKYAQKDNRKSFENVIIPSKSNSMHQLHFVQHKTYKQFHCGVSVKSTLLLMISIHDFNSCF